MDFQNKWKKFNLEQKTLSEEKGRSRQRGVYKFLFMIGYGIETGEKQRGLDDIATDMRALPNVTIVTVVVGNKNISERTYVAGLSVKYVASTPGQFSSPEETKARIIRDVRRLRGVQRIYKISTGLDRIE
jgi:hypothetical protein